MGNTGKYIVIVIVGALLLPLMATGGSDKTTLQIGSKTVFINGEKHTLDTPPIISNGRTLVPLRFISQVFDAKTKWYAETRTIEIEKQSPDIAYDNYGDERLYELISTSQKSIYIQTHELGDDYRLISALKNAGMIGLDVRILTDSSHTPTQFTFEPELELAGCEVKWDTFDRQDVWSRVREVFF